MSQHLPPIAAIKKVCDAIESWNRLVFGSISRRKGVVMARLRGIQKCLDRYSNGFLIHLEPQLQLELERIIDHEELLWKQKSRSNCISMGDRNTSYFHKKVVMNKRANRITSIVLFFSIMASGARMEA
ncbi:hypothetical protein V6N13_072742 [Hibiscus sabdariffa]